MPSEKCCQIQRRYYNLFWRTLFLSCFFFTFISYQEKATVQSLTFKDQPMRPLDRAVYWVEYVIRNGGAKHLKSDSIGLNDFQYFLFDVLLIFFISILSIACFCYFIFVKIMLKLLNILWSF